MFTCGVHLQLQNYVAEEAAKEAKTKEAAVKAREKERQRKANQKKNKKSSSSVTTKAAAKKDAEDRLKGEKPVKVQTVCWWE